MNWYCAYKSQEEGYILTDIPQWKVLAGTKLWTCDVPTQICFDLHPYLPHRNLPFSWLSAVRAPIQVTSTLGDCFAAVASKLSRALCRLSLSLYALKVFVAHLLGLHAPATEPGFTIELAFSLFFNSFLIITFWVRTLSWCRYFLSEPFRQIIAIKIFSSPSEK